MTTGDQNRLSKVVESKGVKRMFSEGKTPGVKGVTSLISLLLSLLKHWYKVSRAPKRLPVPYGAQAVETK